MSACLHCHKPFKGLARRGRDWGFGSFTIRLSDRAFCSDECESMYATERAEEVRVLPFLQFLARPP